MTTALIGLLAITTLLMAMLWRNSKAQVEELNGRIASLKRQLARNGR
ncbi:MAG TPA: hypothetical protein VE046_01240 [Steroidobacteraceae bacterium]|nr:hypothetical protein [Steroidobacteraceae bacterium]